MNMVSRNQHSFAKTVVLLAFLFMGLIASTASASAASSNAPTPTSSTSETASAPTTPEVLTTKFKALPEGQSFNASGINGSTIVVTKTQGKPVLDVSTPTTTTTPVAASNWFCVAGWATVIIALGAAALAFMAVSGGGVIAGIVLSATEAGQLSALLTGGAAIEGWIAANLC